MLVIDLLIMNIVILALDFLMLTCTTMMIILHVGMRFRWFKEESR